MGHSWEKFSNTIHENHWRCSRCGAWVDRRASMPKPSKGMKVNMWVLTGNDNTYSCDEVVTILVLQN